MRDLRLRKISWSNGWKPRAILRDPTGFAEMLGLRVPPALPLRLPVLQDPREPQEPQEPQELGDLLDLEGLSELPLRLPVLQVQWVR